MALGLLLATVLLILHTRHVVAQRHALREGEGEGEKAYRDVLKTGEWDSVLVVSESAVDSVANVRQDGSAEREGYGFVRVPFTRQGLRLLFYCWWGGIIACSDLSTLMARIRVRIFTE